MGRKPHKLIDIAWAAGLFEGEGSISAHTAKNDPRKSDGVITYFIRPDIKIKMTDKDVLEKFFAIVSTGKIRGPYKNNSHINTKLVWEWSAYNKEAIKVLEQLSPFFCSRRKAQIETVMASCGNFNTKRSNRRSNVQN